MNEETRKWLDKSVEMYADALAQHCRTKNAEKIIKMIIKERGGQE